MSQNKNLTYFKIRSPQGRTFFATPDASETYRLTGTEPKASTTVKEFEPCSLRVYIVVCQRVLGEEHPDTLIGIGNLALIFKG